MNVDNDSRSAGFPPPGTWMSYEDVLYELAVARSTMDNWRRDGKAPRFVKLPNGALRTRRDWLYEWLERLGRD